MRRAMTALTLTLLAAAVPSTMVAQDGGEVASGDLFVQTARSGSLVADAEGRLILALDDVDPRVVYFGDRPARTAGTLSNEIMVEAAFSGESDPNAALLIEDEGPTGVIPLELSAPTIGDGTISYAVSLLEALPDTFAYYDVLATESPVEFGEVALFIDTGATTYQIYPFNRIVVTPTSWPSIVKNVGTVELRVATDVGPDRIIEPGASVSIAPSQSGTIEVTNDGDAAGVFIVQ